MNAASLFMLLHLAVEAYLTAETFLGTIQVIMPSFSYIMINAFNTPIHLKHIIMLLLPHLIHIRCFNSPKCLYKVME